MWLYDGSLATFLVCTCRKESSKALSTPNTTTETVVSVAVYTVQCQVRQTKDTPRNGTIQSWYCRSCKTRETRMSIHVLHTSLESQHTWHPEFTSTTNRALHFPVLTLYKLKGHRKTTGIVYNMNTKSSRTRTVTSALQELLSRDHERHEHY